MIMLLGISGDLRVARGDDLPLLQIPQNSPLLLAQLDPSRASSDGSTPELDPWAGVEELVVTGSDQAGALLSAPTAVTSFGAVELEAQAVLDVGDISAITPNLEIRRPSATQASFFIRGVGLADFGANATSAVSVVQDGVGLNTAPLQLGQIYDASAVNVLRGPRGTGAFRNGSAGAIVTTSHKPEFDLHASLRSRLGTWAPSVRGARQGLIQDYEGVLNVPLIEDVLATRFAFRIRKAQPYKVNGCGGAPPFNQRVARLRSSSDPGPASQCGEKDPITFPGVSVIPPSNGISPIPPGLARLLGEQNNWSARGMLLFRPPGIESEVILKLQGSRLDQQPAVGQATGTGLFPNGGLSGFGGIVNGNSDFQTHYTEPDQRRAFLAACNAQGGPSSPCSNPSAGDQVARSLARNLDDRPYRVDVNRVGRTRLETFGANLTATGTLLDSGFSTLEYKSISGYDTYKRYQNQDSDFTPETIFESVNDDKAKQIWQELSLSGMIDSVQIEWDVGAYYFYEDLDADLLLVLPNSPFTAVKFDIRRQFEQKTSSFGIWLNGSWDIFENTTLDAGVRYNSENKKFDFVRTSVATAFVKQNETWTAWTGMVSLEHRFTEDISFAMKYSRGFKSGTFNAGVNAASQTDPVKPESIDAFEGILAASFLAGRLSFRAEFFYYLYKNYQVFLFRDQPSGPPALLVRNAAQAENFGADVDLTLRPLEAWVDERFENLKVNFKIGWLESRFIEFTDTQLLEPFGLTLPVETNFSGNRLPNSPRLTVSGTVVWAFDLGRVGVITPRYDFTFQDDTFFDAEEGRGNRAFDGSHNLPKYGTGQRAYFLHNLRLTYQPRDSPLEISGWVRNLRDQRFKTFAFDASAFSNLVINSVGQPRTVGVDIKFTF